MGNATFCVVLPRLTLFLACAQAARGSDGTVNRSPCNSTWWLVVLVLPLCCCCAVACGCAARLRKHNGDVWAAFGTADNSPVADGKPVAAPSAARAFADERTPLAGAVRPPTVDRPSCGAEGEAGVVARGGQAAPCEHTISFKAAAAPGMASCAVQLE
eukprot:1143323-Prymnesium_polylepis.1